MLVKNKSCPHPKVRRLFTLTTQENRRGEPFYECERCRALIVFRLGVPIVFRASVNWQGKVDELSAAK